MAVYRDDGLEPQHPPPTARLLFVCAALEVGDGVVSSTAGGAVVVAVNTWDLVISSCVCRCRWRNNSVAAPHRSGVAYLSRVAWYEALQSSRISLCGCDSKPDASSAVSATDAPAPRTH